MSPEILIGVLQFGAMGLLAVTLYFGLQANARMIEILAEALQRCHDENVQAMSELESRKTRPTDQ
jgi:DhnA family fructose-bisphosphate aldolase class Ia